MWQNSTPFPTNTNKSSFVFKSSFSEKINDNISNNFLSDISLQNLITQSNNNNKETNKTPFILDLKYFVDNLNISGPNNKFFTHNKIFQEKEKDNFLKKNSNQFSSYTELIKGKIENCLFENDNSNIFLSENINPINIDEASNNNFSFMFNTLKNDNYFFYEDTNINNAFQIEKEEKEGKEKVQNKNMHGNFIFNFSTPKKNNKNSKKIFQCSDSAYSTKTSIINYKRKRMRKTKNQLIYLKNYYKEHKEWNKKRNKCRIIYL